KRFGSSGRTRTYNPSVNSQPGCNCLTLQTRVLTPAKTGFHRKLGGLWGDPKLAANLGVKTLERQKGEIGNRKSLRSCLGLLSMPPQVVADDFGVQTECDKFVGHVEFCVSDPGQSIAEVAFEFPGLVQFGGVPSHMPEFEN